MEEDGEWVFVHPPTEIDFWNPSLNLSETTSSDPLKVQFTAPAKHWTNAAPIGNGRLGAMVWGGVVSETLQLNEDTLWTGVPLDYTNSEAPKALAEVRKLVDEGEYVKATEAAFQLSDKPSDVYQLLGDIKLEFDDSHVSYTEESYRRELDLDTATVKVRYSVGDVEFTREHFISYPDQVIVTKISASKSGSLSFTVSLDSKLHHHSLVNGDNQIVMEGTCRGKRIKPKDDADPKGIKFSAVVRLQVSGDKGVVSILDHRKLKVENSDSVVLLLVASSSFGGPSTDPQDSKKNPTSESLNKMNSLENISYADLYTRHLSDYQSLFHRVSLKLSKSSKSVKGENDRVSTAERVKAFKTDEDPSMVELLFQYGRYLLIACSRPGTQPSNLQGIWNKDVEPAWDGAPHLNINLQMNYWPSLSCNLRECQEPLFDYISSLAVNGSRTARVNYEASGWVAHQVSDVWAKTSPDYGDPVWAFWPMGGAWLVTHLWEHYTYTMDKGFLEKKAYPLLESCASFLSDWLIEGKGGFLGTNPSTSPEHRFVVPGGKTASVSYSTTMDMSIIREVFTQVISASEILGKTKDALVQKVKKAQARLYPTKIARNNSIMEWAEDFQDPEPTHRHVSHLFGLFPGHTITVEKTPDLSKAAENTLLNRGEEGPGWSTTWKASLWARLHSSKHAYRMVKHLIDLVDPDHESDYEGGLYSNLFTAHPPFQIDANFGFSTAIAEMLVQSTVDDLNLLPALPRDKWASGCVKGLKARGGVTVNICWTGGELHEVGLWSKDHNSLRRIRYNGATVTTVILPGNVYTFNKQLKCVKKQSLF
ncbi:alpha-L-fucosidase 2-like [Papaver somniferum]|uniref:alpha-L-fucosidase 2-like n=1 Tax=Papaver somniferum TaxID=3469 RepID=UPI000E7050D3|nr:alpha-L-fucosidase 2-like [Papaver somniferum]